MAPKYMIEAGGDLLIGNMWITYARAIPDDNWILLSKGDWENVVIGKEAKELIDELLKVIYKSKTPEGAKQPSRVAWWRVTEVP
jgi:hypothetical protein